MNDKQRKAMYAKKRKYEFTTNGLCGVTGKPHKHYSNDGFKTIVCPDCSVMLKR